MEELNNYEDLNPLERGQLFKRIKENQDLSYKEMGDMVGKSASYVANSVRLIDLPIAIKDGLMGGVISEGHARALASLDKPQDCISVYKEVLRNHSSVRDTEQLVREAKSDLKKSAEIDEDQAEQIKESLEKILKTEIVKIKADSRPNKLSLDVFLSS